MKTHLRERHALREGLLSSARIFLSCTHFACEHRYAGVACFHKAALGQCLCLPPVEWEAMVTQGCYLIEDHFADASLDQQLCAFIAWKHCNKHSLRGKLCLSIRTWHAVQSAITAVTSRKITDSWEAEDVLGSWEAATRRTPLDTLTSQSKT